MQVPTWPEWTLFDLVQHLGQGRRFWAATVAAGPAAAPPAKSGSQVAPAAPREREALLAWPAASTQQLPDEAALDGVDEFLSTCCAGTAARPHEPTVVDYPATEGHSWR